MIIRIRKRSELHAPSRERKIPSCSLLTERSSGPKSVALNSGQVFCFSQGITSVLNQVVTKSYSKNDPLDMEGELGVQWY